MFPEAVQSINGEKAWSRDMRCCSHGICSQEAERWMLLFRSHIPFHSHSLAHGMVPPTFRVRFYPSVNCLLNTFTVTVVGKSNHIAVKTNHHKSVMNTPQILRTKGRQICSREYPNEWLLPKWKRRLLILNSALLSFIMYETSAVGIVLAF